MLFQKGKQPIGQGFELGIECGKESACFIEQLDRAEDEKKRKKRHQKKEQKQAERAERHACAFADTQRKR